MSLLVVSWWRRKPGRDPAGTVFKRPRGLLWQAEQVPAKIWDGLLPASRFCACTRIAAKQAIRRATVAKLSARLNIHNSPDAEITSSALRFDTGGGDGPPFSRLCREWKRTYDAKACPGCGGLRASSQPAARTQTCTHMFFVRRSG